MPKQPKSRDLKPGDQLRHNDGDVVTLLRRKSIENLTIADRRSFQPGWWLVGSGGLSDIAIEDLDLWTVVKSATIAPAETDRTLTLRVTIPFYGREKHAAQIADRAVREIRLSVNSRARVEQKVRGKWVAVEPTDHMNEDGVG